MATVIPLANVGVLLLLIRGINFMNLGATRAIKNSTKKSGLQPKPQA